MSYTTTTRLALQKAVVGSNQAFETSVINSNWDKVDAEAVAADTRLDNVEALNTTQNGRLDNVEGRATALEGRATTIEGVNTTQNGRLDTAEANIAALGAGTSVRTVSGTSDTTVAGDKNNVVVYNASSAISVTLAPSLPVGARIDMIQNGTGQISFIAGAGVAFAPSGKKTAEQYAAATVVCIATNTYRIIGNLVSA